MDREPQCSASHHIVHTAGIVSRSLSKREAEPREAARLLESHVAGKRDSWGVAQGCLTPKALPTRGGEASHSKLHA